MTSIPEPRPVMTSAEVAKTFHVNITTVNRWVNAGKLRVAFRTIGGHTRFYEDEIHALLNGGPR